MLGKPRVRELLDNPAEVDRLATNLGVTAKDVTDVAAGIVGDIEKEQKVPVALRKHINDPNAENMAANQAPDYPAIFAVATELGEDAKWVLEIVNSLRPNQNKDNYLVQLLEADAIAQGEMPNVAGFMVKDWAQRTGVAEDFIKQRLVEIHKANEAEKARLTAEAEAKAKAEAAAKAKAAKRKAAKKKKKPPRARVERRRSSRSRPRRSWWRNRLPRAFPRTSLAACSSGLPDSASRTRQSGNSSTTCPTSTS